HGRSFIRKSGKIPVPTPRVAPPPPPPPPPPVAAPPTVASPAPPVDASVGGEPAPSADPELLVAEGEGRDREPGAHRPPPLPCRPPLAPRPRPAPKSNLLLVAGAATRGLAAVIGAVVLLVHSNGKKPEDGNTGKSPDVTSTESVRDAARDVTRVTIETAENAKPDKNEQPPPPPEFTSENIHKATDLLTQVVLADANEILQQRGAFWDEIAAVRK